MNDKKGFLEYLSLCSDDYEALLFLPIIEIAGDQRVLIENHLGVVQFCTDKIGVRVVFGEILVCGNNLSIRYMSKSKLVISGIIDQITVIRRNRK